MIITTLIHDGPHHTDKLANKILSVGTIESAIESARVTCGQKMATRGKRVFVEFNDGETGAPITSRVFCEDMLHTA